MASVIAACGVFDTVKLRLRGRFDPRDIAALIRYGVGWRGTNKFFAKGRLCGSRYFVRGADGLRVRASLRKRDVTIEFSLPRVLSLPNHRQAEVSAEAVIALLRRLPRKLLPRTTKRAARSGVVWALVRADLAVDFRCDFTALARLMRLARTPRCRAFRDEYGGTYLVWGGRKGWRLNIVLYDKGLEMAAKGMLGGPPAGTYARFELRLARRGLRELADWLGPCCPGERGIHVEIAPGEVVQCTLPDYGRAHDLVRHHLALLDPPPSPGPCAHNALVRRLLAGEDAATVLEGEAQKATRRAIQTAFESKRNASGISLQALAYPRPERDHG